MSSERIIFKFKPSIDIENEYASSEQFISAYFEGIRMLLGENRLSFDVNNPKMRYLYHIMGSIGK